MNDQAKAKAISFAFLTLVLAGCSPTVSPWIPSSLLVCAERPAVEALDLQSDAAAWVVENDAAGEDCRRKLGAVRGIVEGEASE